MPQLLSTLSGGVQRRQDVVANEVAQKARVGIAVVFDPGELGALDVGGDFVARDFKPGTREHKFGVVAGAFEHAHGADCGKPLGTRTADPLNEEGLDAIVQWCAVKIASELSSRATFMSAL